MGLPFTICTMSALEPNALMVHISVVISIHNNIDISLYLGRSEGF